jgi:hypothetical protein
VYLQLGGISRACLQVKPGNELTRLLKNQKAASQRWQTGNANPPTSGCICLLCVYWHACIAFVLGLWRFCSPCWFLVVTRSAEKQMPLLEACWSKQESSAAVNVTVVTARLLRFAASYLLECLRSAWTQALTTLQCWRYCWQRWFQHSSCV